MTDLATLPVFTPHARAHWQIMRAQFGAQQGLKFHLHLYQFTEVTQVKCRAWWQAISSLCLEKQNTINKAEAALHC